METVMSKISSETTFSLEQAHNKTASAPLVPIPAKTEETKLKTQISAPSYLFSLKENDAPPFRKPEREAKPKLLIGTIMTGDEAVEMITAADADNIEGLKKYLGNFIVAKQITLNYNLPEKLYLVGFLTETIDYAAQRDFSAFKLACLVTLYLRSHLYFKHYYWLSPVALWCYFKEIMIRHTIEDSPDGQEVFEPHECYDIMTHFHTVYLSNLPLIHVLTFGAYRLKLQWPFKPKI